MALQHVVKAQAVKLWDAMRGRAPPPRRIHLALQGGGSHGAFTWGVLDRLLEDERFEIAAISGTSAGALNAAVLASGFAAGGRPQARAALTAFWHAVSASGAAFAPFFALVNGPAGELPAVQWANLWLRSASPYEFNPLNLNPLRDILRRHVDEAALRSSAIALFVNATALHSGRPHVFTGAALSIDALLASACLPFVFHAVVIDDAPYWDGGYTGNPPLYPLIEHARGDLDLVLVKINPLERDTTPKQSLDIMERASEISFNASLLGELRAVVAARKERASAYAGLRMHLIADEKALAAYSSSSKLDTDAAFLERLFQFGRDAATRWLEEHARDVGVRDSLDIERVFLG
jgi:NTE family protein